MATGSPQDIRVNAISPGPFPFSDILKNTEFMGVLKAKTVHKLIENPEDPKEVIALLCSEPSGYITGQNICVDGGKAAW